MKLVRGVPQAPYGSKHRRSKSICLAHRPGRSVDGNASRESNPKALQYSSFRRRTSERFDTLLRLRSRLAAADSLRMPADQRFPQIQKVNDTMKSILLLIVTTLILFGA